jgi:catechol 2,3-dioxygenase-like lactoylglutathione lyase family enzyme
MSARRILWAALCGALVLGGQAMAQGLGIGRGIDHVGSLVRLENFDATANAMHQLGFAVTPALLAPGGATNHLIWFDDLSYLEIDAFTESNPSTAPFLDFLDHHEGGKIYGTEVLDAARAVDFLTTAGYPNVGPIPAGPLTLVPTGETVGAVPLWNLVILTSRVAPDNSNFFLDYDEAQVRKMFRDFPVLAPRPHPNTAEKIDTLWMVVADLDAAISFYQGLGLKVQHKHKEVAYLGGRGADVQYHNATLTLLEPDGPGLVADFAADRGEGILGVSLKVARLGSAHGLIQTNTGLTPPVFKYAGRSRFLIPASFTHGLLIEMVE